MTDRFPLDAAQLTEALVQIDSRNPHLAASAPGESSIARFLAQVLGGWGFAVSEAEVAPGHFNVIAHIGPTGRSPLMLNGHIDTVGVDGMTHAPFAAERRDGSIFGRGSSDMKSGVAAMCVAAARAAARGALKSEIIVTAVCDEEYESLGTRALLESGVTASAAIVTEPTRLAICPAHKGFAWLTVDLLGRAAHGSRHDIGIDANRNAGLLMAALDEFDQTSLAARTHSLLGRPSLHVPMVSGGTGWSTYAESCQLRIERRTVPGESGDQALAEVQAMCDALVASRPGLRATAKLEFAQPPLDLPQDAPVLQALRAALEANAHEPRIEGLSCWTDAALLAQAGIPSLCFGPGDIVRAHSATEWVEVSQIETATQVLEHVCANWGA